MDQVVQSPDDGDEDAFARRLERDGLIVLQDASFTLRPEEGPLLDPAHGNGRAKNISLGDAGLRGAGAEPRARARLEALLSRYRTWAREVLLNLAPRYAAFLETGRTSLRPRAVDAAPASPRKDDRRLHVDAFASQPTGGRRILRVFTNINPDGEARHWRIGETFEDHARRWATRRRAPLPLEAEFLHALGVTRRRRTPYDFLMLAIHDGAKLDATYQSSAPARDIVFPAGVSWVVFTDSVVHAAMAGRHALEQTFYLPLEAMAEPAAAPAHILERITGRKLA